MVDTEVVRVKEEMSAALTKAKENQRKLEAENRALKQRIVLIDGAATPQSEWPPAGESAAVRSDALSSWDSS